MYGKVNKQSVSLVDRVDRKTISSTQPEDQNYVVVYISEGNLVEIAFLIHLRTNNYIDGVPLYKVPTSMISLTAQKVLTLWVPRFFFDPD